MFIYCKKDFYLTNSNTFSEYGAKPGEKFLVWKKDSKYKIMNTTYIQLGYLTVETEQYHNGYKVGRIVSKIDEYFLTKNEYREMIIDNILK